MPGLHTTVGLLVASGGLYSPWTVYGGAFTVPGYFKNADGVVTLRGLLTNTGAVATGALIGLLPVGFRPAGQELWSVFSGNGAQRIDVDSTGTISWQGTALPANSFASMSGISFLADI